MSDILTLEVGTVQQLLYHVGETSSGWEREGNVRPWFRGQADAGLPPLPSIFRRDYDEFRMTSAFRLKAMAFGTTPETGRLDQWLFSGQHYGLPTRLLDAGIEVLQETVSWKHSSNGRYVSVRISFRAENREQYDRAHQVLRDHPEVKWTL